MSENNPVNELITIEKNNQELLKQIALNQEELLAVEKQRLQTERYTLIGHGLKFVLYVIIIWVSFTAMQKFTGTLINKIAPAASTANTASNVLGGLKGSQELLNELMNY